MINDYQYNQSTVLEQGSTMIYDNQYWYYSFGQIMAEVVISNLNSDKFMFHRKYVVQYARKKENRYFLKKKIRYLPALDISKFPRCEPFSK